MQFQKWQNDLCSFPRQSTRYTVIQAYAPTSNAEEPEAEWFYEDLQDLLELISKKDVLFIIEDWNAKVGSQAILGVAVKSGIQNESGQRLIEFCPRECTGHSKHPLPTTQEKTTHGHHQMVNTNIRLMIFFVGKDGEALYNQQKQDWEMTGLRSWSAYCQIQT